MQVVKLLKTNFSTNMKQKSKAQLLASEILRKKSARQASAKFRKTAKAVAYRKKWLEDNKDKRAVVNKRYYFNKKLKNKK